MRDLKDILEGVFDVDGNIDNVEIDTLYGCWCATEEKEFAQRSNRMVEFIQKTCKDCSKVNSDDSKFLNEFELDNNKWYVGLNYDLSGDSGYNPIFYKKSGNKFTTMELWYKHYGNDKGGKISKEEKRVTGKLIYIDKYELFVVSKEFQPILDKIIKLAK